MKFITFILRLILIVAMILLILLYSPQKRGIIDDPIEIKEPDITKQVNRRWLKTYIKNKKNFNSAIFNMDFRHPTRHPYDNKYKDKYIALTFDDGPSAKFTPRILKELRKRKVKATFFMLGSNVKSHASIVKQIAKEGHEIGIHSWNHVEYTKIKPADVKLQQGSTMKAIKGITGKKPLLMRPPYGSFNDRVVKQLDESIILWSVDTLDWKSSNKKEFRKRVIRETDGGDIVLMHDINTMSTNSVGYIIDKLKKKGYRFATVSDLIRINSGKDPVKRKVYYSGD